MYKISLLSMSLLYLATTLVVFFTNSGVDVIFFFALFTYLFYIPFTAVFEYDIHSISDSEDMKQQNKKYYEAKYFYEDMPESIKSEIKSHYKYLIVSFSVLVIFGLLITFTSLLSGETMLSMITYYRDIMPTFEMNSLFKDYSQIFHDIKEMMPWYGWVILVIVLILAGFNNVLLLIGVIAIPVILYLIYWLIMVIYSSVIMLLFILAYFVIVFAVIAALIITAWIGYRSTKQYMNKGPLQEAALIFSFLSTTFYLVVVLFINLFTLN